MRGVFFSRIYVADLRRDSVFLYFRKRGVTYIYTLASFMIRTKDWNGWGLGQVTSPQQDQCKAQDWARTQTDLVNLVNVVKYLRSNVHLRSNLRSQVTILKFGNFLFLVKKKCYYYYYYFYIGTLHLIKRICFDVFGGIHGFPWSGSDLNPY